MTLSRKTIPKRTYKDYLDLIDVVSKVEYKRLNNNYFVDFSEFQNIAIITIHTLLEESPTKEFNTTYLSTAIKWAIRNELRKRYNWYSSKSSDKEFDKETVREAIYETILSIDEMSEGDNPTHIAADGYSPEETVELSEINLAVREAIKKLPPRYKEIVEARFFQDKKLKELSCDFELSPSRITRIIQNALEKIKKELQRQSLV
ncbi:MAG: sigma-70 family RNA polymerase sigma factor [Candidatus Gastranaerophilales bacterium]|nr:sigma-70 family RNA polymerase sigma factor [Candidatus Gastranaerophilales bacterium]